MAGSCASRGVSRPTQASGSPSAGASSAAASVWLGRGSSLGAGSLGHDLGVATLGRHRDLLGRGLVEAAVLGVTLGRDRGLRRSLLGHRSCGRGLGSQLGGRLGHRGGDRLARRGTGTASALGLADRGLGNGQRLDQLDDRHGGVVALARTDLGDPGVATRPVLVPRADLGEEHVQHGLVVDLLAHRAPRVDVATLGLGDEPLGQRAQPLGLGLGGGDLAVLEQCGGQVGQHQPLVRRSAAEPRALRRRRHGCRFPRGGVELSDGQRARAARSRRSRCRRSRRCRRCRRRWSGRTRAGSP